MLLQKKYTKLKNVHSVIHASYTINLARNWTENEWPKAVRLYDKEGKLDLKKMLIYVNKHLNYNLTKLPIDEDQDE